MFIFLFWATTSDGKSGKNFVAVDRLGSGTLGLVRFLLCLFFCVCVGSFVSLTRRRSGFALRVAASRRHVDDAVLDKGISNAAAPRLAASIFFLPLVPVVDPPCRCRPDEGNPKENPKEKQMKSLAQKTNPFRLLFFCIGSANSHDRRRFFGGSLPGI